MFRRWRAKPRPADGAADAAAVDRRPQRLEPEVEETDGEATVANIGGEAIAEPQVPRHEPRSQVRQAFWLVLWREPSDRELDESVRAMEAGQSDDELLKRLRSSSEFRLLATAVHDGLDTGRSLRDTEAGLRGLGDHAAFVDAAFLAVLGRPADPSGRAYYSDRLDDGGARVNLLQTLLSSEEFRASSAPATVKAFIPRDVQLCELANPAKWDNPDWLALLRSLEVVPADRPSMHRKAY
jgi:hypothetical protein